MIAAKFSQKMHLNVRMQSGSLRAEQAFRTKLVILNVLPIMWYLNYKNWRKNISIPVTGLSVSATNNVSSQAMLLKLV